MDLPAIIDSPQFAAILAGKIARFTERGRSMISPDFEAPTAADPAWHILVELTLLEIVIREKINGAAYAQLLRLSNDLEFIFDGKPREGESFEAYRERMRGRKYEAATAGTFAMYKALTFLHGEAEIGTDDKIRRASVRDVFVKNELGDLLIWVFTSSDEPDLMTEVIAVLTRAFKDERVKPALDSVTFKLATEVPITISGTITLLPGYGSDYRDTIEKTFRERFEEQKRLGWAPSVSWIIKELHQSGVKSVILRSPSSNIPVQAERYPAISTLNLTVEVAA